MYIIKCTLKKAPQEIAPRIYFYERINEHGTVYYNTDKTVAKRFPNKLEAEKIAHPLLSKKSVISYEIVRDS